MNIVLLTDSLLASCKMASSVKPMIMLDTINTHWETGVGVIMDGS